MRECRRLLWRGTAAKARYESIHTDQRFSDHAPLTIDNDFKL
jgi:exonuclease III